MIKEITHFHLFCGLGGGAMGFNKAAPRVGSMQGEFRCLGGIDSDPGAIEDFSKIVGIPGTLMDLFDREQYIAWHGHEPPKDWKEATPADIQKAAGNERPNIVFTSAPCKGFSGLLSQKRSTTDKYQALNRLTLRGIWLTLEAWSDDPPEFILFENVPRIANRGRALLDQIEHLLHQYGYATAETVHDCGELGGLAQSRRRFLLVARHQEKVPPFLYEPPKKSLRAVGDILGKMPLPGSGIAGPMHRVPNLQWKTWVRLAFVEAGSDWRSLNRLNVKDGYLTDYLLVPEYHHGYLGVNDWSENTGTVTGRSNPTNGKHSIADPRFSGEQFSQFGVKNWDQHASVVTGQKAPGQGPISVSDPRPNSEFRKYSIVPYEKPSTAVIAGQSQGAYGVADPRGKSFAGKYKVTGFDRPANTVVSGSTTGQGAFSLADPRIKLTRDHPYGVIDWEASSGAVASSGSYDNGRFSVADPRPNLGKNKNHNYHNCGRHYGVVPWGDPSLVVSGNAKHDNGYNNVADPRLPESNEQGVFIIQAMDNTWHRPFTTLELAALQSLFDPEDIWALNHESGLWDSNHEFLLHGRSDSRWREGIGNAVPGDSAKAIAEVMGETLLLAWSGETFVLGSTDIWVSPLRIALSVDSYRRPEQ